MAPAVLARRVDSTGDGAGAGIDEVDARLGGRADINARMPLSQTCPRYAPTKAIRTSFRIRLFGRICGCHVVVSSGGRLLRHPSKAASALLL